MANVIDPLALESWEDAFLQPIPEVRKVEAQLRRHADENREKLRTLVGVSYRELLGTAERIIDMNAQVQEVEITLSSTGQKCNPNLVSRAGKTYLELDMNAMAQSKNRNALAAQLAILEACPTIVLRILRRRGSLLLAAKLLLLSRLTHKTLASAADAPPIIEHLRERLASLRVKLLRAIDKRFADVERDVPSLVDDMCAFSLATSSTPSDVLQHFLRIRLRAIAWHLGQDEDLQNHSLKALQLLLDSLRSSKAIFPKRLADSLVRLKDLPLVKQADVQEVHELRLAMHGRWLGDELKNYTPWPRHDELDKYEAEKLLKTWAKTARRAFTSGLKTLLGKVKSFDSILAIRQSIFETWPWSTSQLPGLHPADVIDELREVLNERLMVVLTEGVETINEVCTRTASSMSSNNGKQQSLWLPEVTSMEPTGGGKRFKATILQSYNGMDVANSPIIRAFEEWTLLVRAMQSEIKRMREMHWNDDLDDDDDDEMDSRQTLLSEDDPRELDESLHSALTAASTAMMSKFEDMAFSTADVSAAASLLRILRELTRRASLQDRIVADVVAPLAHSSAIISPLHGLLASAVSSRVRENFSKSLHKLEKSPAATGKSLWEGKPPLPIQPSVIALKFLKAVTQEMTNLGADLWSEAAATALKTSIADLVAEEAGRTIESMLEKSKDKPATNGHKEDADADAAGKESSTSLQEDDVDAKQIINDKLITLAMDLSYLDVALATRGSQQVSALKEVVKLTFEQAEFDEAAAARIRKSSWDYWKRTYLLFALLAI